MANNDVFYLNYYWFFVFCIQLRMVYMQNQEFLKRKKMYNTIKDKIMLGEPVDFMSCDLYNEDILYLRILQLNKTIEKIRDDLQDALKKIKEKKIKENEV